MTRHKLDKASSHDLIEKQKARERKESTGTNAPRNELGQLQPVTQMFGEPETHENEVDAIIGEKAGVSREPNVLNIIRALFSLKNGIGKMAPFPQ